MLQGEAKKQYQREYMRRYRSNKKAEKWPESVRPCKTQTLDPVRPKIQRMEIGIPHIEDKPAFDADGNEIPEY